MGQPGFYRINVGQTLCLHSQTREICILRNLSFLVEGFILVPTLAYLFTFQLENGSKLGCQYSEYFEYTKQIVT